MEVTRADASAVLEFDIAAPRQVVWEHLTLPGHKRKWWPADDIIEDAGKGRRGVGTKVHCMHGEHAIIEETLDWRPPDYFTIGVTLPVPGSPRIVMTRAVLDGPNGTRTGGADRKTQAEGQGVRRRRDGPLRRRHEQGDRGVSIAGGGRGP